jgi:hypothetical protein
MQKVIFACVHDAGPISDGGSFLQPAADQADGSWVDGIPITAKKQQLFPAVNTNRVARFPRRMIIEAMVTLRLSLLSLAKIPSAISEAFAGLAASDEEQDSHGNIPSVTKVALSLPPITTRLKSLRENSKKRSQGGEILETGKRGRG